jgi:hypothetical protein
MLSMEFQGLDDVWITRKKSLKAVLIDKIIPLFVNLVPLYTFLCL